MWILSGVVCFYNVCGCFVLHFGFGEREREGGGGGWVCMWLFAINYFLIYTKKQSIFCYSLQLYKKLKHLFFENA